MAATAPRSSRKRNAGRHRRRDTDRVVRWLQAGAVVTGVGAAVISGQGIAWADTDADSGATDSSDSSGTAGPGGQGAEPDTNPSPEPADEQDEPDEQDEEGLDGEVETPISEEDHSSDHDPDPEPRKTAKKSSSPRTSALRTAAPEQTISTPAQHQVTATAFAAAPAPVAAAITPTATTPFHPPVATVTVTEVNPPQVTGPRPIRQLALRIFGFLGYNPNAGPGAPAPNPLLEALWGLYRRVESAFDNQRPTVQNVSVTDSDITAEGDVIVTGAIDFDDTDGDPLTFKVKNGTHGTVTVSPNGTFTYTPTDPGFTGTDTFTVTANDSGRHIHGLFGIFGAGHTRTASVTITLTEATNDGPVITVDATPGMSNSWTIDVDATDPDDDPVTVTVVPVNTGKVTVTAVDGQPGRYNVTVTDTEWGLANPGKQLSVNVTATDGLATTATAVVVGTVSNVVSAGVSIPALPPGVTYTKFSMGDFYVVFLRSDGSAIASGIDGWGAPDFGPPDPAVVYTDVAVGDSHIVLLKADGTAIAVGSNFYGQLTPTTLPPGVTVTDIAAGHGSSSYLLSDGTVIAYGLHTGGLANLPPLPAGVRYTEVIASYVSHFLLRSDGNIDAYGYNEDGQLYVPPLPAGLTYTKVGAGFQHTLFVLSDGTVVTSGSGGNGKRDIPPLPAGLTYVDADAGTSHSVLLRSDGTVVTSGTLNSSGQLNIPTLPAGIIYTQMDTGRVHNVLMIDYAS